VVLRVEQSDTHANIGLQQTLVEIRMKILSLLPIALLLLACNNPGPLEQAGEEIDEAFEDIAAGGETLGNKIDDAADDIADEVSGN
jgi:hypothetical protein